MPLMGKRTPLLQRLVAVILVASLGLFGGLIPDWRHQDMANANDVNAWPDPVVVEWLEFKVPADEQAKFITKDEQIWTAALRGQPGFLHKSVWTTPDNPESVTLAIYWASREDWSAFPPQLIDELDRQMQPTKAELVDAREFRVQAPLPDPPTR